MGPRGHTAAIAATAALVVTLLLAGASIRGLDVESAHAAACRNADGESNELAREQARDAVVCLVNNRRDTRGRSRLHSRGALDKAAGRHTRRMQRRACFSHQCPGERDLAGRLSATSYLPCRCSWGIGENIAWGGDRLGTPREIVRALMDSPTHRRNILDRDFRHIGVGVVWGTPSNPHADGGIYTTDFGYKRD
jgi:uncharacterized protein YkwD